MLVFTLNRELLDLFGALVLVLFHACGGAGVLKNPAWTYSTLMVIGVLGVHFITGADCFWVSAIMTMAYFIDYFNMKYIYAWFDYLSPARSFTETGPAHGRAA